MRNNLVVDGASVADFDYEDDEVVVFDLAEDTVVADAVAPCAGQAVPKRLAVCAGIVRWCDAIFEEAADAFGYRLVNFGEVALGALVELNRPHRRDQGSSRLR